MLLLYKEAKTSAKLLLANTNIHFCDFSQLRFVLRIKFRPSSAQPSESSLISPLLTEMAEGSMPGMPETDITALTEALYAQQQLLQKLYSELDQEREASSTAADEALSMILRLQGEKSAMKMEASQYKRLAEEKICHAEEALAIFEDLIYQKEMEIASLEFQLQAYRYKLLSMGCSTELGAGENVYPENLLFQRSDLGNAETGVSGTIRRINSLPPLELKEFLNKKSTMDKERDRDRDRDRDRERERERDRPMIPKPECVTKKAEKKVDQEVNFQSLDVEKKSINYAGGNMNTIWEQIKKLDARVKEISDCKDYGREKSLLLKGPSRTCSLPPVPKVSINTSRNPTSEEIIASLDKLKQSGILQEREAIASPSCSSSVHDVFEVPQSYENTKACEGEKKELSKLTVEVENRLGKPDLVLDETSEIYAKDETDRVRKILHCKKQENKIFKPRDGISTADSNLRERLAGVTESQQAKFQQLWRRIEQLEGERNNIRQEISHAGEEELKLFQEIHEHLNLIQSEMRSWKPKKPPRQDDEPLHSVMEAMLHFWL
ncbi:uncharacterized protein LOC110756913 isoform X2 [Prunus avium]|uniref:Uncharacterized protein LOC110756913 isoform X1 n=2 Tax=Prunus avium TaxID=42229 RepID=A0A6P5SK19_PRUAV|nr:uncharacterized protein LOC110756913 isoform X1 [Prunus avium]XP_021814094.1 uncharacterized protein LOC110756913 isoform X2 [Prunus avium]